MTDVAGTPQAAFAPGRIRAWLQFGILDLLILTTVVAVIVSLCQPVSEKSGSAAPWLLGTWSDGKSVVFLSPDGCYSYNLTNDLADTVEGVGWRLVRGAHLEGAFVLTCGELRLLIRTDWGSDVMEELSESGSVQARYQRLMRLEGPLRAGEPHGTWTMLKGRNTSILQYRDGELIDCHDSNGWRDLALLNGLRSGRGWPPLGHRDFTDEDTAPSEKPSP